MHLDFGRWSLLAGPVQGALGKRQLLCHPLSLLKWTIYHFRTHPPPPLSDFAIHQRDPFPAPIALYFPAGSLKLSSNDDFPVIGTCTEKLVRISQPTIRRNVSCYCHCMKIISSPKIIHLLKKTKTADHYSSKKTATKGHFGTHSLWLLSRRPWLLNFTLVSMY